MKKLLVFVLILAFATAFALPALAAGANIAANASWTASSEFSEDYAAKFVVTDTVEWDNEEWASAGDPNPSITAEFPEEVWINKIILYDRPNVNDCSADGVITFSDGSTVEYTDLDTEGNPLELNFEPKKIKSFTIQVNGRGVNNGFAKIEVHDCDAPAETGIELAQEETASLEETAPSEETQSATKPDSTVNQAPATGDFSTIIILSALILSAVSTVAIVCKRRTEK